MDYLSLYLNIFGAVYMEPEGFAPSPSRASVVCPPVGRWFRFISSYILGLFNALLERECAGRIIHCGTTYFFYF